MKKYRSQSEPIPQHLLMEKGGGESKTIPDQAMHMREILHRYTTGQSLNVGIGIPTYTPDAVLYDTRRKHIIDIAEDRHVLEREIDNINSEIYDKKTKLAQINSQKRAKGQTIDDGKSMEENPNPTG